MGGGVVRHAEGIVVPVDSRGVVVLAAVLGVSLSASVGAGLAVGLGHMRGVIGTLHGAKEKHGGDHD
jgi:hypothetical protein